MSIIEQILAGLVIAAIIAVTTVFVSWMRKRFFHVEIRVEKIPVTVRPERRDLGFIGPVLQINVTNKSDKDLTIKDLRIMFCRCFGMPVLPYAPTGYSHPNFPAVLPSETEESWYIPVENASNLLRRLHHPSRLHGISNTTEIKVRVKCTTTTKTVYRSSAFLFSKVPDSDFLL